MGAPTAAAIILIVLGAFSLAFPTLTHTKEETLLDAGPLEVTTRNREFIPLPRVLGGTAIAAGIVLVFVSGRRP
jgi:hypothetical protein